MNIARAIAAALARESCGFRSSPGPCQWDDSGSGSDWSSAGELLGWPHATIIIGMETTPTGVRVKRELEAGEYQHLELPLPRAHHPKRNQQVALRQPDGNQTGQAQAVSPRGLGGGCRQPQPKSDDHREDVHPGSPEEDTDAERKPDGDGAEAG